jgi:hypothetical protein
MSVLLFADAEDMAYTWVKTTSAYALANNNVYLAMPKGSPLPCITLSRAGGGISTSTVPTDEARISFSAWGKSRQAAKAIAKAIISEADALADAGGFLSLSLMGRIEAAEVLTIMWVPDQISDTPRYIIDVRFAVTPIET